MPKNPLRTLLDETKHTWSRAEPNKVSFVGEKTIDQSLVAQIIELSKEFGWYSNFGPVNTLLEKYIAQDLNLPDDRSVVMAANGTCALFALIGMHDYLHKKKMRWVVSSFGFFTTGMGPLANATIVDCDQHGMLSLDELNKLDPNSYDGIVVTNVFGLVGEIKAYKDFCATHNKILIMDNAAAYYTPIRDHSIDEMISFHHTKPAGFGEGGCVIVDKANEKIIKSMLNFGVGIEDDYPYIVQNGKLSDISAAYILQRLQQLGSIKTKYQEQYTRIKHIAKSHGYHIMHEISDGDVQDFLPASVPMTLNTEVDYPALINDHLVMRKYYKPLSKLCSQSVAQYAKNINLPCNPNISSISDEAMNKILSEIA